MGVGISSSMSSDFEKKYLQVLLTHYLRHHRRRGNLSSKRIEYKVSVTLFAAIWAMAATQNFSFIVTSHRFHRDMLAIHPDISELEIHHDLRILTLKPYGCVEFPSIDPNRLSRNKIHTIGNIRDGFDMLSTHLQVLNSRWSSKLIKDIDCNKNVR